MDYWSLPDKTPRESQVRCLEAIDSALESYDNIILEAGVGIGKSAIAVTLANSLDSSYITTMTNQLQSQYIADFPELYNIRGRSNYPCILGGTCQDCRMEQMNKAKCVDCHYLRAVKQIAYESKVITNYDYLYYAGNFAGHFIQRDLIVFDEAHNFEKKMMSLLSKSLNRRWIHKRYGFDIFEPVMKRKPLKSLDRDYWEEIIEKCIDEEKEIYCENEFKEKEQQLLLNKYSEMKKIIKDYIIDLPLKKEIIADKDISERSLKITLKPLQLTDESKNLFKFGRKKLFMTGTLGDKDKFCEWNGIDSDDTYYHYEKSPFSVKNRPIYQLCVSSMKNNQWMNSALITVLQKIIRNNKGKGVIHTSSNQQAWWIKKSIKSNKVLVASGKKRTKIIKDFEESPSDLVIIGAGIKDGVDFNDDKCRFQILFKMPFPSIGDEQIRQRKKLDESWYMYQTVMPLMQSYGRGVRNEDDWCKYYILDRDFKDVLNEYNYFFNEYFLEAIV